MSKQDSGSYRCRPTASAARIAARPERGAAIVLATLALLGLAGAASAQQVTTASGGTGVWPQTRQMWCSDTPQVTAVTCYTDSATANAGACLPAAQRLLIAKDAGGRADAAAIEWRWSASWLRRRGAAGPALRAQAWASAQLDKAHAELAAVSLLPACTK